MGPLESPLPDIIAQNSYYADGGATSKNVLLTIQNNSFYEIYLEIEMFESGKFAAETGANYSIQTVEASWVGFLWSHGEPWCSYGFDEHYGECHAYAGDSVLIPMHCNITGTLAISITNFTGDSWQLYILENMTYADALAIKQEKFDTLTNEMFLLTCITLAPLGVLPILLGIVRIAEKASQNHGRILRLNPTSSSNNYCPNEKDPRDQSHEDETPKFPHRSHPHRNKWTSEGFGLKLGCGVGILCGIVMGFIAGFQAGLVLGIIDALVFAVLFKFVQTCGNIRPIIGILTGCVAGIIWSLFLDPPQGALAIIGSIIYGGFVGLYSKVE